MEGIDEKIAAAAAKYRLPVSGAPAAAGLYEPVRPALICGRIQTLYLSGCLPVVDGALAYKGRVGEETDVEEARQAARICALNLLANLRAFCRGTERVTLRLLKLTAFIASAPDFTAQPQVANAASELLIDVFGDSGRCARSAVGVLSLPLGAPVEIELIAEIGGSTQI